MRRYVCEGMLTQPNNSLKGFGRLSSAVGIFWKVLQCKLSLNRPVVTETQSNSLWGLPVCFGLALWKSQRGCVWSFRQNCPLAPDGYQTPKRNRRADTEERGCVDKTVNRVDIAQLYTTHNTYRSQSSCCGWPLWEPNMELEFYLSVPFYSSFFAQIVLNSQV